MNNDEKIMTQVNRCIENGKTTEWMTKGRTCFILKDEREMKHQILGRLRAFISCERFS